AGRVQQHVLVRLHDGETRLPEVLRQPGGGDQSLRVRVVGERGVGVSGKAHASSLAPPRRESGVARRPPTWWAPPVSPRASSCAVAELVVCTVRGRYRRTRSAGGRGSEDLGEERLGARLLRVGEELA